MENLKKVNIWSENGDVYSMEEGDIQVYDLDINTFAKHANDQIRAEVQMYKSAGYEVIVGKPDIVEEIEVINENDSTK